jgi:ATP-dependent DNA helicase RecG
MPEHQNIEWKEVWRDEYLRWICGFANAEGGTLVIGRNNLGAVVGVTNAPKLLEDLPNKIRDVLGIMADVRLVTESGRELVEIHVEPYPSPISYRGEYHYRSGSTKQELKGAALARFLLKKQGLHWDSVPMLRVRVADLDPKALAAFRRHAARSGRLTEDILDEDAARLVDRLHLTDGDELKRAAVLLFHPEPEHFFTGAFVKIGFFRTNADLVYHDEIYGSLFTQVGETMERLFAKYLKASLSYEGVQRIETWPVPEPALREAILNAIAHKDYASGAPIQISVYADKLLIWNPGQLPPDWTVARLTGKHASIPFNPDIANAFFRAGMVEAWGRGIERIFAECVSSESPEPKLNFDESGIWMEFPFLTLATDPVAGQTDPVAGQTDPVAGQTDPVADPVAGLTDPVTDPVAGQTDPVDMLIVALGEQALAPSGLLRKLNLKHRQTFRDNYLHPALKQGLIEMTLPDKPNSRLQQYRLTESGKARFSLFQSRGKS